VDYESLVYPPHDAPLMEAYGSRYESLYVILHPFVGVPGELAWKATTSRSPVLGQNIPGPR
jgi:hypothetical protein